jgi:hypothetical protein
MKLEEERKWNQSMDASRRLVYLLDRRNERDNKSLQLQIQMENMKLAQEAKQRYRSESEL